MPNYLMLPGHMRESFRAYIEEGRPPGRDSFVEAVLCNDLVGAFSLADQVNRDRMQDFAAFLYQEVASGCWGSPEAVAAHLEYRRAIREAADKAKEEPDE